MGAITFNTGVDLTTLFIQGSDGSRYSFSNTPTSASTGNLLKYGDDLIVDMIKQRTLASNGITLRRSEYQGAKGSFMVGRINGALEAWSQVQQLGYSAGNDPITYTIHVTITNRDGSGSISEYQITNCIVMQSKGPEYAIGQDTSISFDFEGDYKVIIQ